LAYRLQFSSALVRVDLMTRPRRKNRKWLIACSLLLTSTMIFKKSRHFWKTPVLNENNLKIASCVTGQLRSLANDTHRTNFLSTFYAPLMTGALLDTYFHLDRTAQTEDESVMHVIRTWFKPIRVVIEQVSCDMQWCKNTSCIQTGYSQFKRVAICMDMVTEHENGNFFKYDFILRVRPDVFFFESLPRAECWSGLKNDIVWDYNVRFLGERYFGNQTTHVAEAKQVDFMPDMFSIVPREKANDIFKGIAKAYEDCIPEIAHDNENRAIGGDSLLHDIYGMGLTGGCGVDNQFWRWNECRQLFQMQLMNLSVGRLQSLQERDVLKMDNVLIRCREDPIWCRSTFAHYLANGIEGTVPGPVTPRNSCFPAAGYIRSWASGEPLL